MRKASLFIAACVASFLTVAAQTLNVRTGAVVYQFPATLAGEMQFGQTDNGYTLTVGDKTFQTSEISEIYVDETDVTAASVAVAYNGTSATVTISGDLSTYVAPTVSGAHVTLVQSDNVSAETCGEITYTLSGSSADGSFTLEGSFKASVELNGLTLTNPSGPAVNIQDGKRIDVSVKKGTENTLTDGAGGDWKGCFVCKGHTEFKGKGTLNVYGKTAHGIWSGEYVEMKNCTINVLSAVKDGVNCNEYFLQESGALTISGVGDDGLQVSYDEDDASARDEDDTAALTITGGTLKVTCTANAAKGLNAEGPITISEADSETPTVVTVACSGGVTEEQVTVNNQTTTDYTASTCLKSDVAVNISGGTVTLTNTGQGGRALRSGETLDISGGTINATASGANYGTSSSGGGGGWWAPPGGWGGGGGGGRPGDNTSSSGKNAKCIKVGDKTAQNGVITISGGTLNAKSANHECLECKGTMEFKGGAVYCEGADDAINSAGDLTVSGGVVVGYSVNNDGLDANGNMYIKGGAAVGFGAAGAESGIDIDEQHTLQISGGDVFGIGARVDARYGTCTQAYGSASSVSVNAGNYIVLYNDTDYIYAIKAPATYSRSTALVSSPSATSGTYSLGYVSASAVSSETTCGYVSKPALTQTPTGITTVSVK